MSNVTEVSKPPKSEPSAVVIADSIYNGTRLTTFVGKMHRFVLAELNTHRAFSRNSASSRAIPAKKLRQMAMEDPAMPIRWGANKPGMSDDEELSPEDIEIAKGQWLRARFAACLAHITLESLGLHKQVTNRLIEPFLWHAAIITTTELGLWNFMAQRCVGKPQPEMLAFGMAMQLAFYRSTPVEREPVSLGGFHTADSWHLPFITEEERKLFPVDALVQICTGRCARVSYLNHDGVRDINADVELTERLAGGGHWSPFEHAAYAQRGASVGQSRNFGRDWVQYRSLRDGQIQPFLPNHPLLIGS